MVPVARRRRRSARAFHVLPAALALSALGLACRGAAPAPQPEPESAPAGTQRVLLFPLNVVGGPLPSEVEAGAGAVATELRDYLVARGLAVETLDRKLAGEAWLRAAQAHKDEAGADKMTLDGAAGTLARQLRETYDFDVLLLPWIALHAARLKEASASWDGVKRKVDFFALGKSKRARWVIDRLDLWVKAPSLQVLGVSAQGEKLVEGVGGLDLVEEAELDLSASTIRFDMVPKEKIFEDLPHLREGIALALAPLLPPSGARGERPGPTSP